MGQNKPLKKIYLSIFIFIVVFSGVNLLINGIHMAPDSQRYSDWADILLRNKFNVNLCRELIPHEIPLCFYMGFLSIVMFAKMISRQFWAQVIVLFNIVSFGLTGVMLAYIVYAVTKNRAYIWFITLLYTFSHELSQWVPYILSDAAYLAINFVIYYLVVRIFKSHDKRHIFWYWSTILICLGINVLFRPVGIAIAPIVLASFLIWYFYHARPIFKNSMLTRYFLLGTLAISLVIVYIHSFILSNFNVWPVKAGSSYFNQDIIPAYQEGIIIDQRPHTNHQPPKVLLDYAAITGDKFIHYFYFTDRLYSLKHNVLNIVFFSLLYFLFLLGAGGLIFKHTEYKEDKYLITIAVFSVFIYALYHALTRIDFDWRYRLPVMPYLLVVASFGIHIFKDIKTFLRNNLEAHFEERS